MDTHNLIKTVLSTTKRQVNKLVGIKTFEKIILFSNELDIESLNGVVKKESNHILFKTGDTNFKLYIRKIKNIRTDGNCYIISSQNITVLVYVKYNGEKEIDLNNIPDKFNELL